MQVLWWMVLLAQGDPQATAEAGGMASSDPLHKSVDASQVTFQRQEPPQSARAALAGIPMQSCAARVFVDRDGLLDTAQSDVECASASLEQYYVDALQLWTFEPTLGDDGQPIAVAFDVHLDWQDPALDAYLYTGAPVDNWGGPKVDEAGQDYLQLHWSNVEIRRQRRPRRPEPVHPRVADCDVRLYVGADGVVDHVFPARCPAGAFEASRERARGLRFHSHRVGGQKTPFRLVLTFSFR